MGKGESRPTRVVAICGARHDNPGLLRWWSCRRPAGHRGYHDAWTLDRRGRKIHQWFAEAERTDRCSES
jgi:hypothetical protein